MFSYCRLWLLFGFGCGYCGHFIYIGYGGKFGSGKAAGKLNWAVSWHDYRADVGLNVSKSPVNLALGAKDELTQKHDDATRNDQAFNLGPLRAGGHSESQALQAGIDQAIN